MSYGGFEGFAPPPSVSPELENWFAQISAWVASIEPINVTPSAGTLLRTNAAATSWEVFGGGAGDGDLVVKSSGLWVTSTRSALFDQATTIDTLWTFGTGSYTLHLGGDAAGNSSYLEIGKGTDVSSGIKWTRGGVIDTMIYSDVNEDLLFVVDQAGVLSGTPDFVWRIGSSEIMRVWDAAGLLRLKGTEPALRLWETDAPADEGQVRLYHSSGNFRIQSMTDAGAAGDALLLGVRSGTTWDYVEFGVDDLRITNSTAVGYFRMYTLDGAAYHEFHRQSDSFVGFRWYHSTTPTLYLQAYDFTAAVVSTPLTITSAQVLVGNATTSVSLNVKGTVFANFDSTADTGIAFESGTAALATARFDCDAYRFWSGGAASVGEIMRLLETGEVQLPAIATAGAGAHQLLVRDASNNVDYLSAPVTSGHILKWNGTNILWDAPAVGDADTLDGQEGTWYQSRLNHTGTQAVTTLSGSAPTALIRSDTAGTAWEVYNGGSLGQPLVVVSGATNNVWGAGNVNWTYVSSTPTTLSGYGIPNSEIVSAIANQDISPAEVAYQSQIYQSAGEYFPAGHQNQTGTLTLDWDNGDNQMVSMGAGTLTINVDNTSNMNETGFYRLTVHGPSTGSQTLIIGNVDSFVGTDYTTPGVSVAAGDSVIFIFHKTRNRADGADWVVASIFIETTIPV